MTNSTRTTRKIQAEPSQCNTKNVASVCIITPLLLASLPPFVGDNALQVQFASSPSLLSGKSRRHKELVIHKSSSMYLRPYDTEVIRHIGFINNQNSTGSQFESEMYVSNFLYPVSAHSQSRGRLGNQRPEGQKVFLECIMPIADCSSTKKQTAKAISSDIIRIRPSFLFWWFRCTTSHR